MASSLASPLHAIMPEGVVGNSSSSKCDQPSVRWEVEDPSEFRPELLSDMGKDETKFRVFNVSAYPDIRGRCDIYHLVCGLFLQETDPRFEIVKKTYTAMHKYQTVDSVRARVCVDTCYSFATVDHSAS